MAKTETHKTLTGSYEYCSVVDSTSNELQIETARQVQLPGKPKQNFKVSSGFPDESPSLEMLKFCLYFSGSSISLHPHLSCYRLPTLAQTLH